MSYQEEMIQMDQSHVPAMEVPENIFEMLTNQSFVRLLAEKLGNLNNSNTSTCSGSEIAEKVTMPAFVIPHYENSDKLKGHSNYRSWKQRVERDMLALGRSQFLKYDMGGPDCTMTKEEKHMYNAQVLQYLEASLQHAPKTVIENEQSAAEAFQKLTQMFGKNDVQKMVELLDNFGKTVFYPRMNPVNFVSQFEKGIQEFKELGVPLDPKIVVAYFLHKVKNANGFLAFFTTMTTLPEATRTYEFVKNAFLEVANCQYFREVDNSMYTSSSLNDICSECFNDTDRNLETEINEVYTACSLCFDYPIGESNMFTNNLNSVSVFCIKCGKSDNNICDFCLESRHDRSYREPHTKKEKNSFKSPSYFKEEKADSSPYSIEQLKKIRNMTPAEKREASCKKCGLLFHRSAACTNTERFCYYCHKKGHEKKDCRKLKEYKSKN
ncbi:uncharacterized protein LOC123681205 [Harmonia axyridis]|uniref:uncharacterized protein LOC123681205 n=1 Tax=Harmonia axyridis TaxID=115357 RepID=UPI001E2770B8|nr:uncharacterized protein LOC123681205 [Harmonia axyridis]